MPTLHFIQPDGRRRSVEAKTRQTLMRAAVTAGIAGIAADCGGLLSCATCHVIVEPDGFERLAPASADEASMLELTAAPREPTSRLACQIALDDALDGLVVRLPSRQT